MKYNPSNLFKSIYESILGKQIWEFLYREDNLFRYAIAVKLGHPPVEVLDELLLDKFEPEEIIQDNVKQMIGEMIRQIMETIGYEHVSHENEIHDNRVFTHGSTYRKIMS